MNSNESSQTRVLLFSLRIPGRLPLWNAMLALSHWQRMKFKKGEQDKFMSALQAAENDSLTRTVFARSTFSTAAATLAWSLETQQKTSALRRAKKKSAKVSKRKQ